jgi:hypothetical protein
MSHSHPKKHIPYCLNCHYPLAEMDSFCPNCGQKPTDGKVTLHDLLHEFTHTLFHVDGKLFSTLKHIFVPGKLTEEFFKGHHKRYAHPIQLFLVLGALFLFCLSLLSHKLEEQMKHSLDASSQQLEKKRMIANLDSTARQMSVYKNDPSVRKALDSLLTHKLEEINNKEEKNTNLRANAYETTVAIATKRIIIKEIQSKEDSLRKIYPIAYPLKIKLLKRQLQSLEKDSILLLETFAKSEHTTIDSAKTSLRNYSLGRFTNSPVKILVNGKAMFVETDSLQALFTHAIESEAQKEVAQQLGDEMDSFSSKDDDDFSGSFIDGVKAGWNNHDEKKQLAKSPNKNLYQAVNNDSIGNFGVTIAKNDIQDLKVEAILEKYHVEGFWKRRAMGATIISQKSGQDKLHSFTGKALWIIVFSLLPCAAVLWLFYRRQKRYFVEHLVWLLHVYCFIFLIFPLVFVDTYLKLPGIATFGILLFGWTFFAFKYYYKQGWGKTFVKYALFSTSYFFIILTTFTIGGILSFLFF